MTKLCLFLAACLVALTPQLHAQISGVTITPVGATGEDSITITVDPAIPCPDVGPGLAGVSLLRLHAGITVNGGTWQNVVNAGPGGNNLVTGFTQLPNGRWRKKILPRAYFHAFSDQHIEQLCFVLNGGPDGTNWDNQGKRTDSATGACVDFFVSFPLAGPITGQYGLLTSATANGAVSLCDGDSVSLTATAPPGAAVAWYKNWACVPGATGRTFTAHASATYLALATDGDSSWTTNRIAVNIAQPVGVPRVDSIPPPICAGTSARLVATNANHFRWYDSPTGQTVVDTTDTFITPHLSAPTTYYVSSHLGFCDGPRLAITVPVKAYPATPHVHGDTACTGASVTLAASGGAAGSQYTWYSDTLSGPLQTGTTYAPGPTPNAITYLIATDSGCKSRARKVVTTFLPPPPAPAVTGPLISCPYDPIHLQALAGGAAARYNWYADSTSTTPLYTADSLLLNPASTRTLWVASELGTCQGARTRYVVNVYPRPQLDHTSGTDIMVTGIAGISYHWILGGLDTVLQDSILPAQFGFAYGSNYVLVTTPTGCIVSTDTLILLSTLPRLATTLTVAPNPAHSHVQLLNAAAPGRIYIYNTLGALIRTEDSWQQGLDLGGLPAGVYHLRLGKQAARLVVE